jgi:hypothetical protein
VPDAGRKKAMTDLQDLGLAKMSAGSTACSIIIAIFMIVCMAKIFMKADRPWWAAIIPFYNIYTLFKITFGNGWLFLLEFIPIVNIIIDIILNIKLAKAFGKGAGFTVGLILLPIIFIPILAFGSASYSGPQK